MWERPAPPPRARFDPRSELRTEGTMWGIAPRRRGRDRRPAANSERRKPCGAVVEQEPDGSNHPAANSEPRKLWAIV